MTTVFCALLMYFSMVISESLVTRTFGSYTLQLFDVEPGSVLVPLLGVGLLAFAFAVNISGNRLIATFSLWMAVIKIDGIASPQATWNGVICGLLLIALALPRGRIRDSYAGWDRYIV